MDGLITKLYWHPCFIAYAQLPVHVVTPVLDKHTDIHTNTQTQKPTNKQTKEQTNKQTNKGLPLVGFFTNCIKICSDKG